MDDAIDLGRLVHGAAAPRRVDEHRAHLTDEAVAGGGGDGVLHLGALAQTLEGQLGGDLVSEVGGVGARLVREGEEAGPVELCLLEELKEQVVVALGLARVAEDERGTERGPGVRGPDRRDASQETLTVAPAPHVRQQRTRDVLERQVEVGNARIEDRLDQLVGQARGIEVQEAGALDPRRDGASQRGDGRGGLDGATAPPGARAVAAVGGEVLGHEDDLAQGWRRVRRRAEGVDLGQDLLGRTGTLLAPEGRYGAEAADPVAALGDLHVGPGGAGGGARQLEEVEPRGGGCRRGGTRPARANRDGDRRSGGGRSG